MADFAMAAVEVLGVGLLQLERRWLARIIRGKMRSTGDPSRTKAMQLCLEEASGASYP
jgi:hypothetical protein